MATMRRGGHGLQRGMIGLALLVAVLGGLLGQPTGAAAAGERTFYGPSEDGCTYAWDGAQWVEKLCPLGDGSGQIFIPQGGRWVEFGPYDIYEATTGCYYAGWLGDGYREALCPQADGTWHTYVASTNGQWVYDAKVTFKAEGGLIVEFGNGLYIEHYADGSSYVRGANGHWSKLNAAGNVILQGGPGGAIQQGGNSTDPALTVVLNNMATKMYNNLPNAGDYHSCLMLGSSSTDYNNNGRTGMTELEEHCEGE